MSNQRDGLSIRGDSLYCPLSFSLDSYWMCTNDCTHCYFRRLNYVWGKELRPINPSILRKKLENGLKNPNPRTSLAHAIKNKNTIRLGNKSDPFQPSEVIHRCSREALKIFRDLEWSVVIQTKYTRLLMEYVDILKEMIPNVTVMPIISPGFDLDWEVFENSGTTPPEERIDHLVELKSLGINVGVNGEPFIPGFHTVDDFENVIIMLKEKGIPSYNTYNFHFNAFVAKRIAEEIDGIDIEEIWEMNKDENWRPILLQLIEITKKHDIILGCPDWVNSGNYIEKTNTCCGINVPNPTTFNVPTWKRIQLSGETSDLILHKTWDGVGNWEQGEEIFDGSSKYFFTLKDIKRENYSFGI